MIRVVVDDLAFVKADAVVRPATATLDPLSPSLRRLEQVGGPAFLDQLLVQDELAVGSAVVTGAGDLAADFVVHAVISSVAEPVTPARVRQALVSVLQRAGDWQLQRIAVPPIGTGAGNLDLDDAARIMVEVLGQAMATGSFPQEVYIVVDREEDRAVFDAYLKRLPQ
ncbi:MAG: macro domain-containing protein [Gemmatimonadota bacterium]|nr:MAG: macro domain-containing protein [Gemmatimonadota bacterium]